MESGRNLGGNAPEISSPRLLLRGWRDSDLVPFSELNADPQVTRWLGQPLTRAQSDEFAWRIQHHFDEHGFGLWGLELAGIAAFAGYVGFAVPTFDADFTPCVEIGWRLAPAHWGHGYVTEAARACLDFGFGEAGLAEIVSFTAVGNQRSRAVMERLGMHASHEFDHPRLAPDHPLLRHVLYRLAAGEWEGGLP